MVNILPIPALHDNYIWIILHPESSGVLVVDPGEAPPVLQALEQQGWLLQGILLTHHHWDHTHGVTSLCQHQPAPIYGAPSNPLVTNPVHEGDHLYFSNPACHFAVIDIPGHTLDHVAYVGEKAVFCGDTLFTGGCGRLFEGTAEQMFRSLEKLAALPADTRVYCGHEYTMQNLAFAKLVEPDNQALLARIKVTETLRQQGQPTVPSTLSLELETNPFLRSDKASVQSAVSHRTGKAIRNALPVFTATREWKDQC